MSETRRTIAIGTLHQQRAGNSYAAVPSIRLSGQPAHSLCMLVLSVESVLRLPFQRLERLKRAHIGLSCRSP